MQNAQSLRKNTLEQHNKLISKVVDIHYKKIIEHIRFKALERKLVYKWPNIHFIPGISIEFLNRYKTTMIKSLKSKLESEKYHVVLEATGALTITWDLGYNKEDLKFYLSEIIYHIYEKIKAENNGFQIQFSVPFNVRYNYEMIMEQVIKILLQKNFKVDRIAYKILEIKW